MRNLKWTILVVALMLASTQAAVKAATVYTVGSGWQQFSWTGGPNVFDVQGAFTFTTPVPVHLEVTDFRYDGDQFKVFDFGSLIGTTSVPANDSFTIGDNADAAFLDPRFSHGSFLLGAGSHSLTFETILSAYCLPDGTANFRAYGPPEGASPVPVPSAVYGGGILLLCLFIARKRSLMTI